MQLNRAIFTMGKGHSWLLHQRVKNKVTICETLNGHIFATEKDIDMIQTAFSLTPQDLSNDFEK